MSSDAPNAAYDILIRNALVYDGSGKPPIRGSLGITGDRIAAVGELPGATGRTVIDAGGLAVSPGFINMMSWANETLIQDGRSQSDLRQGVTLEILGEGRSMGPLNEAMKKDMRERQGRIKYPVEWTTLGEYLDWLARRGVSCNIASFVGATSARVHVLGYENRDPSPKELDEMCRLVRQAMEEGAVGMSSSLQYNPAFFAKAPELTALAKVTAEYDGLYASHVRSESNELLESVEELIAVAEKTGVRAEIYHLKASGRRNWHKMDTLIERVESVRKRGLRVTADMYPYHASSTGLDIIMPEWVQEGGHKAWVARLKDPAVRERLRKEIRFITPGQDDAGTVSVGTPDNILLVGFETEKLKPLTGKTLADVAAMRGTPPVDTAMDLIIEDDSRIDCVFFSMSEETVRRLMQVPWVSFCSDAGSYSAEGIFLEQSTHPRAYGAFARVLGKFSRDENRLPLEEAIRRMTSLPADNMKLGDRGRLAAGAFADVVVFDPAGIRDVATFDKPHQYAVGVKHVLVNGVPVIRDGEHTGAKPGRVVRGPGYGKRR